MERYKLISSTFTTEEGEKYTGYGIAYDCGGEIRTIAEDISVDRGLVEDIISRCNKFEAAPEHAADIIYDSIL